MNSTLAKALLALVPASMLLVGSAIIFVRRKITASFFQLLGAIGFVTVALSHLCEGFRFLPWMNWGRENSIGHYVDLAGAVLAIALFPIGYLLHALQGRRDNADHFIH